jgi:2-methylcitrate dehydratase PrpD
MGAGMSRDADVSCITDRLGTRWAIAETSFKFHASCRHTHPAADALLQVVVRRNLRADEIAEVVAHVHHGALDVLGAVTDPKTVHQAKFSMGTVLALIALYRRAGMLEFDRHFNDAAIVAFRGKVRMELDREVDAAYPGRWIGKVTVRTTSRETFAGRIDEPKGDPGNTLSRAELDDKALRLASYSGAASPEEMRGAIARIRGLADLAQVGRMFP